MNLKSLIIAALINTQTQTHVFAHDIDPILRSGDFTHVEQVTKSGMSALRLNLTQAGIDKLELLKLAQLKNKITFEVKGKFFSFKVRQLKLGDQIEVGPFGEKEAKRIADELSA